MDGLSRRRSKSHRPVSRISPYLLVIACSLVLSGCVITAVLPGLGWATLALAAAVAVAACSSGGGGGKGDGDGNGDGDIEAVATFADASALESAGSVDFTVTLAEAVDADVSVDYATADGTAEAGTDYEESSGTLTIAAGDTSGTISVPIEDNSVFDAQRTFTLALSDPGVEGVTVDVELVEATGTILNDEAEIDLGDVEGTIDADLLRTFVGAGSGNQAGFSIAGGDLVGDSNADLVIGAPKVNLDSAYYEGSVYVIEGGQVFSESENLGDVGDGTSGETIVGADNAGGYATGFELGRSVAVLGNLDGDGKAELGVSAPKLRFNTGEESYSTGSSFVIQGDSIDSVVVDTIDYAHVYNGYYSYTGSYVIAPAGDVDGDGTPDIVVGDYRVSSEEQGSMWVISGDETGLIDVVLGDKQFVWFYGYSAGSGIHFGESVAGDCDFDGDGKDDVIAGAPDTVMSQGSSAFIVFGAGDFFSGDNSKYVITLPNSEGIMLSGVAEEYAGVSVACAGDLNDDGKDDVLVGAPYHDSNKGAVYVVFGNDDRDDIDLTALDGSDGFIIEDSAGTFLEANSDITGSHFGISVAGGRDLNGDDVPDIVAGAMSTSLEGAVFVILGSPDMGGSGSFELAPAEAGRVVRILPETSSGGFGRSVAFVGDINGDGFEDIAIGAPYDEGGDVFLLFGGGF